MSTATKPAAKNSTKGTGLAKATASIMALAIGAGFATFESAKSASAYIDETISLYAEVGERMHNAAVAAAWHAVTHRNPALLNRLYSALRSNDQAALKLWLRTVQVTNGLILSGQIKPMAIIPTAKVGNGPLPGEIIAAAEDYGTVVKFENNQFSIVADTVECGKALAHLIAARWFSPTGDDKKVFVRNNIAAQTTFDDADALAALLRAADPKATGRRVLHLSPKVSDLLAKVRGMIEPTYQQVKSMNEAAAGHA